MRDQFLTEPAPARGAALAVAPGVRRVVAPNPGPMTYHGTNTYLLNGAEGAVVIDPGPDSTPHVLAVLEATAGWVGAILLTHAHHDHLGAVAALQAATGAPVHAWHASAAAGFVPDVGLRDGDVAAGLRAVHTPGHAPDHLCFAARDGTLFSGDHVMGWSTSTVNPPAGRMADYVAGLRRLLQRDDTLYLPGHGPPLPDPQAFVQGLIAYRRAREDAVMTRLAEGGQTAAALTQALYAGVDPRLLRAAERNVLAHLVKLEEEGRAVRDGAGWRAAG